MTPATDKRKVASPFSPEQLRQISQDTLEAMTDVLCREMESAEMDQGLQIACMAGASARVLEGQAQGKSPEDVAQSLAWKAYEEPEPLRAVALALQAAAIDPGCVDAAVTVATLGATSPQSEIAILRDAVREGEKRLGRKFFRANKGHFWGLLETRPYMRARTALAEALWSAGQSAEAIAHYEAMLELNPHDNQGLRYALIGPYFCGDRLDGVQRLLQQYADDDSAVFNWARVLERFVSCDLTDAAQALERAKSANPHVLPLLTGKKRLPRTLPAMYGHGDKNEAIICVDALLAAWHHHAAAMKWLKGAPVVMPLDSVH
ncbi:MAG: tetratricopeptide repeat protein [Candidatus Acidiferrales bacterium]